MFETSMRKNSDVEKLETLHVEGAGVDPSRRVQWDSTAGFDPETERRLTKSLLRKLDTRMLPMLAVLFLFSFLDRTNIGNAKASRPLCFFTTQLTLDRFSASRPTCS
jgi:hypothetical protein